MTILDIVNLQTAFNDNSDTIVAVDHVSLSIQAGEILALVGESGSGKSVTAHSILRLLPKSAHHDSGEILFEGKDLLKISESELRKIRGKDIAMIFQEPMTALNPLHTVEKQIGESIQEANTGIKIPKPELRKKVLTLLKKVQIDAPETRLGSYPHELSGGQRQRVMIAMAIANTPKLLIADEPTTALDVTVQKEIIDLLRHLSRESDMAVMLITHDLAIVKHFAERVAVMKEGKIVETGDTAQVFERPENAYTQTLLHADITHCNPIDTDSPVILEAQKLCVSYPIKTGNPFKKAFFHALNDASFSMQKGETLGIVGESGSGKSTLANAILKLTKATGSASFQNIDLLAIDEKRFRKQRKHIQMVFQDPFASLNPRMNIGQIVGEGLQAITNISKDDLKREVTSVLEKVGLSSDIVHRFPHEFSGGQRQRIAIARALIMKPQLIVLDEPTSALDRSVQFQVLDLLSNLQEEFGLSYLFISHDLSLVKTFCHRVLVVKNGNIVEQGSTEEVFDNPQVNYTQQLIQAALG